MLISLGLEFQKKDTEFLVVGRKLLTATHNNLAYTPLFSREARLAFSSKYFYWTSFIFLVHIYPKLIFTFFTLVFLY